MAVIRDVMPAFTLFQPASLEETLALVDRYGADAWVMAGGPDTFDWLKDRIRKPRVVLHPSGVNGLPGIKGGNGGLGIGEPPVGAGASAVMNALSAALGDEVFRRAPITADVILASLEAGRPVGEPLTAHI